MTHKIDFTDSEGNNYIFNIKEFESFFGIRYLKYSDITGCYYLKRQTNIYLKKSEDAQRALWLGVRHKEDLLSGYIAPMRIYWVDDICGFGAAASVDFKKGTYLGSYAGKVKRRALFSTNINPYCFSYSSSSYVKVKYTTDAEKQGNEIRFFNHSETPNCEAITINVNEYLYIIIRTIRDVVKGEQFCYNYGPLYWRGYKNIINS
jgi:uncharacterized protein